MMMLIEYHLAVMLASVLIPWGIWRLTAGIAEFSLGWLTGSLIRALVSSAMVGIATPLFALLNQPVPGTGFYAAADVRADGRVLYLSRPVLDDSCPGVAPGWPGLARAHRLNTHVGCDGDGTLWHDADGHGQHGLSGHLADASTWLMEVRMSRSRLSPTTMP